MIVSGKAQHSDNSYKLSHVTRHTYFVTSLSIII